MALTSFAFVSLLFIISKSALGRTIVDMTHALDENAPKIPMNEALIPNFTYYKLETLAAQHAWWYMQGMWVSFKKIEFFEHYGTHMDAPSHFGHGQQAMDEIPPERLIGPGVVINVKEKARMNPNYEVSVEDLLEYEANYGRIPPNAIVLMNSGWSKFYPLREVYLGTQDLTNVSTFNFPGFGMEACEFLQAKRQVSVVGVDTNSVDPGQPSPGHGFPYACHFHLQPNNVPLLENVANLDSIPAKGTTIILGGIKIRSGTGGPTRIVAFVEDVDDDKINNGNDGKTVKSGLLFFIPLVALKLFIRI